MLRLSVSCEAVLVGPLFIHVLTGPPIVFIGCPVDVWKHEFQHGVRGEVVFETTARGVMVVVIFETD
jgi:hypothetical protein